MLSFFLLSVLAVAPVTQKVHACVCVCARMCVCNTSLTYLLAQQNLAVRAVHCGALHHASPLIAPEQTLLCEVDGQTAGRQQVSVDNDHALVTFQRGSLHAGLESDVSPEQLPQKWKEKTVNLDTLK